MDLDGTCCPIRLWDTGITEHISGNMFLANLHFRKAIKDEKTNKQSKTTTTKNHTTTKEIE